MSNVMPTQLSSIHLSRGSEWQKWDLHVHSPLSILNNQFPKTKAGVPDWELYLQRLEGIDDIAAIGVTDYFTIEGYKRLREFKAKDRLQNIAAIFPNIEFRLSHVLSSKKDSSPRRLNFHVIFSDEVSPQDIEEHFLHDIKFFYQSAPQDVDEARKLKPSNLEELGKRLIAEHAAFKDSGKSPLEIGAMNAVVNHEDITEILRGDSRFRGKYMIVYPEEGYSLIDWDGQDHHLRKGILQKADMVFSSNPKTIQWCLGRPPYDQGQEAFIKEFRSLKPCIHGSDAHSLDEIARPCARRGITGHSCIVKPEDCDLRYCWIKADISFEGLKQITYEPELRVRVQSDNPREEETYAKIEKLHVDLPDDLRIKDKESNEETPFCIQGRQEIHFSPNLTCIIGGRGSGKSTLVHTLYNLVPKRDAERLSGVNSPLLNLQVDSKDVLGKIRSLTKADIPSTCEFFLQNEVEKFARDVNEMSSLIRTRLYGLSGVDDAKKSLPQMEMEWLTTADDVDALISAYDEMTRIDQQISSVNEQRATLKKQTAVISSKEYKNLQGEIEQLANDIATFDTYKKEYQRISSEISNLIKSIGRLDWSKYAGRAVLDSLSADLEKRNAELKAAFGKDKAKYDASDYSTKLTDKKTQLKKFLKGKGLSPENIGEVAAATQQIAELDGQIKELQQERVPHQEVYDRKDTILEEYRGAYAAYKKEFEAVTSKLRSSLENLTFEDQQTIISFELRTNDQLLKDEVAEFIKSNNTSKVQLRSDFIQKVLFEGDGTELSTIVSDKQKIVEVVGSSPGADVHTQIIQELINEPTFLEKLHLRLQRLYFHIKNIQVQTKLGEKLLQNTSFGERCGIVMAIVLVAGTNPIIIDQPEDNLDGKYVSNVLVPLIRDQKLKRQIILVTRDANIAIGGDSELILILDKEERGTALIPGTIENKVARPKYIWILDGGERAFQKREEKYAIQRVL